MCLPSYQWIKNDHRCLSLITDRTVERSVPLDRKHDWFRHLRISRNSSRQVRPLKEKYILIILINSDIFYFHECRTHSPGLCLVLWCICSFYSFLGTAVLQAWESESLIVLLFHHCIGALSYCELGTVIPKSGGEYSYFLESFGPLHRFFGPLVAFLYIWINIFIINPCSLAANSLSFATYVWVPILTLAGVDRENTYLFGVLTRIFAVAFISMYHFFWQPSSARLVIK